jgi:RNA polymerase sigma factor (TIGR02999 family)
MLSTASAGNSDVTRLLADWSNGDRRALDELLPLVYEELRHLANAYLRRERDGHTLQSTALVHEAFLRLVKQRDVQWRGRAHFFGIAAQMIRRILVDHARAQHAGKRGAGAVRLELDESIAVAQQRDLDLIALDDALGRLAVLDERQSRIVELRFFAGLSVEDTAELMGISTATVKREWASARAWLFREIAAAAPCVTNGSDKRV